VGQGAARAPSFRLGHGVHSGVHSVRAMRMEKDSLFDRLCHFAVVRRRRRRRLEWESSESSENNHSFTAPARFKSSAR